VRKGRELLGNMTLDVHTELLENLDGNEQSTAHLAAHM
jgi:hypothetical protein